MSQDIKPGLKINYWFLLSAFILILISAAVTIFFSLKTNILTGQRLAASAEAKRPANLELTIITDNKCPDCYDINKVIGQMEKLNVKITNKNSVERTSDDGKALIEKYQIEKIPTFILTGEINKGDELKTALAKTGIIQDNAFIYKLSGGPYVATATGDIKGRAKLTLITDITCAACYDVTQHEIILGQFGLNASSQVVDVKSALGQTLIKAYLIKMIPAFVLSGDIKSYPDLTSVWSQVGIVAKDGAYVFTKGVPFMGVYKDLTTNQVITPAPETTE